MIETNKGLLDRQSHKEPFFSFAQLKSIIVKHKERPDRNRLAAGFKVNERISPPSTSLSIVKYAFGSPTLFYHFFQVDPSQLAFPCSFPNNTIRKRRGYD